LAMKLPRPIPLNPMSRLSFQLLGSRMLFSAYVLRFFAGQGHLLAAFSPRFLPSAVRRHGFPRVPFCFISRDLIRIANSPFFLVTSFDLSPFVTCCFPSRRPLIAAVYVFIRVSQVFSFNTPLLDADTFRPHFQLHRGDVT